MNRPRAIPTTALALASLALAACGGAVEATADGETPLVVCTTAMVGDLATEIAGDDAEVVVLFGPDVDPHLFRPTRDDVAILMRADLVLYNGFHLEGYLTEALERVADSGTRVVAVAERLLAEDEVLAGGGAPDPHVWMDPSLWRRACPLVASLIEDLAPAAATDLEERARSLSARLGALDERFAEQLAGIPAERRVLVTAHDAFGYFGRRYGITVEGIQGVSTASEAGLRAIEDLVDLVVERELPAVFFESTVSERNVRALVEGAKKQGREVVVGGVLHADAPGDAGTYEAMLEHNVATLIAALSPRSADAIVPAGGPAR